MRKLYFGIVVLLFINFAGCGVVKEEIQKIGVTNTPAAELWEKENQVPTPTGALSQEMIPTPEPTQKATVVPTEEPESTSTPTDTPTPEPIGEVRATDTPTPEPTKKVSVTDTPTTEGASPEVKKMMERAVVYENTVIQGEVQESEEEANEFVRRMAMSYSLFSLIVTEEEDLHTPEQYMELYPEIKRMEVNKIGIYNNGICVVFTGVESVYDANLCYAIRTGDRSVLSATEEELYQYLKGIIEAEAVKELSRVDAVKALHDYLVLSLKYDSSYQEISHTPEGVMRNQTAVCDGYARTLRLLLLLSGIESEIASGTAKGEAHAWNLVKMEDGWYHVDATWDDPMPDEEGRILYTYFLRNDEDMAQDHVWESDISCTGNAYEIYMYREFLCDSEATLAEVYEKQIGTEEKLTFCYPKGGALTQDKVMEYVMNRLQCGISFYPEKETQSYFILQIINPLLEE